MATETWVAKLPRLRVDIKAAHACVQNSIGGISNSGVFRAMPCQALPLSGVNGPPLCKRTEGDIVVNPKMPEFTLDSEAGSLPEAAREAAVGGGKRIFVDVNAKLDEALDGAVQKLGGERLLIQGFGSEEAEVSKLTLVKRLLREGRVIWFRAEAHAVHMANAKWFTQCCRMAHRAGVCWSFTIRVGEPWKVPPWMALKRLKYVCETAKTDDAGAYRLLVSDAADLGRMTDAGFLSQVAARLNSREPVTLAAQTLGQELGSAASEASQAKWYQRAVEDDQALGGLRNPHRCVDRLSGAPKVGEKLRLCIDECIHTNLDVLTSALHTVGSNEVPSALIEGAANLRERVAASFGVKAEANGQLQGRILTGISQELHDPDDEVLRWLVDDSTPLGIKRPIKLGGVFPLAEPRQATDDLDSWATTWNYASYGEHRQGAGRLLRREIDAGWLMWYPSEEAATAAHGPVTFSRIGVVAKQKGVQLKLRLIHDLRRSGVNQQAVIQERVVLPRIMDFIEDVLFVGEQLKADEDWEVLILDFQDAFKHLVVDEAERGKLGGRALVGCFVAKVLLFGAKAGPLLWGRVAALVMRITAVMNSGTNSRLQCYVDDPALIVGGTLLQRNRVMLRTILLWLLCGLRLAWTKGQRGSKGEWVGAHFRPWLPSPTTKGLIVGITKERAEKLKAKCAHLLQLGDLVPRTEIRQLAGLAAWMAGLMPQLGAFTRMLWAAVYSNTQTFLPRRQVETPLRWLAALAECDFGPLERRCRRRSTHRILITFDGSLTGGGPPFRLASGSTTWLTARNT